MFDISPQVIALAEEAIRQMLLEHKTKIEVGNTGFNVCADKPADKPSTEIPFEDAIYYLVWSTF